MNAYLPSSMTVLFQTGGVVSALLLSSLSLTRFANGRFARPVAWGVLIAAFVMAEHLTASQLPGFRMLVLIATVLFGMKLIVCLESERAGQPRLQPVNWFLFTFTWIGMRPKLFSLIPGTSLGQSGRLILSGLSYILLGMSSVILAGFLDNSYALSTFASAKQTIVVSLLLIGLSLALHFGILKLLAGFWRMQGVNCRPLFRAPVRSKSLTEFWSRRWNLAFSEMTAIAVYRPLKEMIGCRSANVVAFLFSGLLHEIAISFPVHAGYGLPLAYFALHALALHIESWLERIGKPISSFGRGGRLWTALWLILPLPLLFHADFLEGVVFPLIR